MATTDMWNAQFIEAQYKEWKDDPDAVPRDWQFFFKGFDIGNKGTEGDDTAVTPHVALQQSRVESLIHRYRDLGHLMACMDPLSSCPTGHPLLNLEAFGLSPDQLDTFFTPAGFPTRAGPGSGIFSAILRKPIAVPSAWNTCTCRIQKKSGGSRIKWSRSKTVPHLVTKKK